MSRLFGTDGIRGEAGRPPLDAATLEALGRALASVLSRSVDRPARVVIGRDTRESGPSLQGLLARGLAAGGATVRSAGILPTPGVAFLARSHDFDAGIMVSASHNPWRDNGVKVFSHAGTKLSDALERDVEAALSPRGSDGAGNAGAPHDEPALAARYADWLVALGRGLDLSRGRLTACVDCANGAAATLAARVFADVGVSALLEGDRPDGRNINAGCGSLHLEGLAASVRREGADLGVAFDGDADRALFVDHEGRAVDGDQVLLLAADWLRARGALKGGGVVGTIMSNHGLERALAGRGLGLVRERVGDRFVFERMVKDGYNLGGEPSGHVIFLDDAPTGDGMLTALHVLAAVVAAGKPLAEIASLARAPQVLRNVRVRSRVPLESVDGWSSLVDSWTSRLAADGRIVVRYSGTEALVRVMVEGLDLALVERCADELSGHLARSVGDSP